MVTLCDGGAWILAIGAGVEQIIQLNAQNFTGGGKCHARGYFMVPAMHIGEKRFQPVGDIFDRPLQQARGGAGHQFVRHQVMLQAKGAAHIGADDPYFMLRQSKQAGV